MGKDRDGFKHHCLLMLHANVGNCSWEKGWVVGMLIGVEYEYVYRYACTGMVFVVERAVTLLHCLPGYITRFAC